MRNLVAAGPWSEREGQPREVNKPRREATYNLGASVEAFLELVRVGVVDGSLFRHS